jgi:hypothetical protein
MQEVTGSSPVSPTNHHVHAQTDRLTASRCLGPVLPRLATLIGPYSMVAIANHIGVATAEAMRRPVWTDAVRGSSVNSPTPLMNQRMSAPLGS